MPLTKNNPHQDEDEHKGSSKRASVSTTKEALPPYTAQAIDNEDDAGPSDLTAAFSNLRLSSNEKPIPDPGECIAHLKLLESFYRLRQTIGSSDGLFGLLDPDHQVTEGTKYEKNKDDFNKVRAVFSEKRWQVYLSRAVKRFECWRNALEPNYDYLRLRDLKTSKLVDAVKTALAKAPLVHAGNLPPIGKISCLRTDG